MVHQSETGRQAFNCESLFNELSDVSNFINNKFGL